MTDFDIVVPAAGASSRMGQWKLLLPWKGTTVIETVVKSALDAGPRVFLVTGFRGGELADRFADEPRVVCVPNPQWETGKTGSIATGAVRVETERFFVTLADMPLVGPGLYETVAAATHGALACRPLFQGRLGHPVLFHKSVVPLITALGPHGSLRELFFRLEPKGVEVDDPDCLEDLDTPEDWDRLQK